MIDTTLLSAFSLTNVLQGIPEGVILFAPDKSTLFVNIAASRLTGLPQEGFYLAELVRLFPTRAPVSLEDKITTVLSKGTTLYFRDIQIASFFYDFSIIPLYDNAQKIIGVMIVMNDVTDRVLLDRAKNEFISLASHQLRTPLGIMRWDLELLEDETKSFSQHSKELFAEIYKSNLRLIELVGTLLNVARIEQSRVKDEPALIDISDIIEDAVKELAPEFHKKSIQIQTKIQKSLPKITIDPKRFREVILNLLSNALHYTLSHGYAAVEANQSEDGIKIAVSDSGIGIPEKDQTQIFSKFFRSENAAKLDSYGSGLGLFIIKSYVERWGGKVWFESKKGKGTTFYITLPLNKNG